MSPARSRRRAAWLWICGAAVLAAVAIGAITSQRTGSQTTTIVVGVPVGPSSTTTASSATTSTSAPESPPATQAETLPDLARLAIDDSLPRPGGYDRDLFPAWLDLDGNGCDSRTDVLIAESVTPAQVDPFGCEVVAGDWRSIFDGFETTDPGDLDVDHLVPLAEAWRSGANLWTPERRAAYANELGYDDHLIAVSASSNRSKGDRSPDEWRPELETAWCRYATAWVTVKLEWRLTATTAERDALGQMLGTC